MRLVKLLTFAIVGIVFISSAAYAFRGQGCKRQQVQQFWVEAIDSGAAYTTDELMPEYEMLKAVDLAFMVGDWKGGKFDGKEAEPFSDGVTTWHGKKFVSRDEVYPLIVDVEGENGSSREIYDGLGQARMREIRFAGKTSAALIYDKQPIIDYFRKVNDDIVIGYGETKGRESAGFFFYLIRE